MEENVILTDGKMVIHDFATNEKKRNFYQAIPSHFGHNDHNKGNIVT